MRCVKFGIIALAGIAPTWAQEVTVLKPMAPGVELIGSQSPKFQSTAEAVIGVQAFSQLGPYVPLTVVLQNNSSQGLVAYQVRWALNGTDRGIGIGNLANKGGGSLEPGEAVVVLPTFVLAKPPTGQQQAGMLRQQGGPLASLQRAPSIEISLDSVILASGQFLGPDLRKSFARDAAYFTAWRPVNAEVRSRLAAGESFDTIAATLAQIENQTIQGSRESHDWNAEVRATEARQLRKLYEKSGLAAVRARVDEQAQLPDIVVHR
jgi:hypothetical protein